MIARVPQANPPLILSARLGLVAVPETDLAAAAAEEPLDRNAVRDLLGGLGTGLGLSTLPRRAAFPGPDGAQEADVLDPAVRQSLEGLDAVWLRGEEVVACFVVETGFAGWEGSRRLADLLALHPKLKAPLYAVTLPALKAGLIAELHRPASLAAKKPLAETLRLVEWDRLKTEVDQMGDRVRYLKPEFLEGISEPVVPPRPR